MAYVPNRGDIVYLDFDLSSGREMKGPYFGLVLSGKVFNQQGFAMICPISQGAARPCTYLLNCVHIDGYWHRHPRRSAL